MLTLAVSILTAAYRGTSGPAYIVPGAGIEPAQHCCHWCLRPARLPIPPSGHNRSCSHAVLRSCGLAVVQSCSRAKIGNYFNFYSRTAGFRSLCSSTFYFCLLSLLRSSSSTLRNSTGWLSACRQI